MASLGHIAVGMAAARFRHRPGKWTLPSMMVIWSGLAFLPDADVVTFNLGIAYADPWGHRGAMHSLAFAAAIGLLVGLAVRALRGRALATGVLVGLVVASHGLLDTLTDGGLGCALLWPVSDARYFAPWRPIPVSPIGRAFFSQAGLRVATTELLMFLPVWVYALWPRGPRRTAPR